MKLKLITVSRNNRDYCVSFLHSLSESVQSDIFVDVNIVTDRAYKLPVSLKSAESNLRINFIIIREKIGYSASLLEGLNQSKDDYDLYVCCNDDILLSDDFFKNLQRIQLDNKFVYAPILVSRDNKIQDSCSRLHYSKLDLFLRYQDGGLATKIFKSLPFLSQSKEKNMRLTVDGCFFFSTRRENLIDLIDPEIFLYYEEVAIMFRAIQKRLKIQIIDELSVFHFGGGSVSHGFNPRRLELAASSRLYVGEKYLKMNSIELWLLSVIQKMELSVRRIIRR